MPAKIAGFFTFKNCLSCSTQAKCFTLYLFLFRLSNQRFVRFAHAHKFACRFATAVNNGCGESSSLPPSPCICFFSACQIKDLSVSLTLINSLAASQRRLTTVTGANSTFTPFTLYLFLLVPSLHKTFSVLFRFG